MFLYRIILIALSPVIIGYFLWLAIRNQRSRFFWQRLGFHYSHLPKDSLWFHCASVGEVNTLLPLLKNIHEKNDRLKIIITSNTITGGKIVQQQKLDYLFHSYLPFDWLFAVRRFLSCVRPLSLHVMETEIWPNLFTACFSRNTPVFLINARLSRKTTSANTWIKSLLKSSLSKVKAIYARDEKNAQAFKKLGAKEQTITTTGNLKLTSAIPDIQGDAAVNIAIDRKYVLLASTHKDEEIQIFNLWKELARNELLIIAPRHPERSAAIIKQLKCNHVAIRSQNQEITPQTEVFLLDTVGELKNYFKNAELVVMGGSFIPIGGHNILEPASTNSAIITGPYMENFNEELALMLDKEAIIQVRSIAELKQQLIKLLHDDDYRKTLKNNTAKLSQNTKKILSDYTGLILATE
ncbi:MAG: 3-deoxy-D-manno-octulosonic acid transferase [Gammaproteobacteria bacterium]|nr:3-deoxy-D-manno-octulosonic acid transferase [Gammaproteobacteria bacterium]